MHQDIIGDIYEAAANPELWPDLLQRLGGQAGAKGGVMFAVGGGTSRWVASPAVHQDMIDFVEEGWIFNNCRADAGLRLRPAGFVSEHDVLTEDEIRSHPIFTDFFSPRGLGWSIGSLIVPLTGDISW